MILPEFDPELKPIGYTVALEFLGSSHRTWDVGSGADTPGLGQVS
jgi:hypothetical protein